MADKNEIRVVIENIITDEASESTEETPTAGKKKKKEDKSSLGKLVMLNAVNQAGQFAVSNYGNLTGDYRTQANIQGSLEMLGLGIAAFSSPLGFAAATIATTIKIASQQMEINNKNRETALLRQRTGYINESGGR